MWMNVCIWLYISEVSGIGSQSELWKLFWYLDWVAFECLQTARIVQRDRQLWACRCRLARLRLSEIYTSKRNLPTTGQAWWQAKQHCARVSRNGHTAFGGPRNPRGYQKCPRYGNITHCFAFGYQFGLFGALTSEFWRLPSAACITMPPTGRHNPFFHDDGTAPDQTKRTADGMCKNYTLQKLAYWRNLSHFAPGASRLSKSLSNGKNGAPATLPALLRAHPSNPWQRSEKTQGR